VYLILIGNVPVMGMLLYFAAISVQQIRVLGRIPWSGLLALTLIPAAFGAFYTDRVLGHVLTVAAYVGVQFVAVTAVGCADYYLLRKQLRCQPSGHGRLRSRLLCLNALHRSHWSRGI